MAGGGAVVKGRFVGWAAAVTAAVIVAGGAWSGVAAGTLPATRSATTRPVSAAARPVSATTRPVSAAARPVSAAASGSGSGHLTLQWPRPAWVDVPVASVWIKAGSARPFDAAVTGPSPRIDVWLAQQTVAQKLQLDDLLATQVLLDERVVVLGRQGQWDLVLVPGQTGRLYPAGVAGWVPASQLTSRPPGPGLAFATVSVPVLAAGGLSLSYGTRLPVAARSGRVDRIVLPRGPVDVPAVALRIAPPAANGPAVVAEARSFLGLPYLWAGTSGFGFDCSGLTYTIYRQFGIELPRDAADQATRGVAVERSDLRPGDLVFFAFGSEIDHVGIYAGHGLMIDSPHTGASVELVRLWQSGFARYYAGARRMIN